MARTFGDRDARLVLSHMAHAWLRLADNCHDAKKVRPVMQQQQQIQPNDDGEYAASSWRPRCRKSPAPVGGA